jgi:hypothetical protein
MWSPEMTTEDPNDALERLLDRTLHELPLRRAPVTLESRVFAELERRAALPWWRRSFAHWPLVARGAFLVICGALVLLAFLGGAAAVAGFRSLHESGALSLSWVREAAVLMASAANLSTLLLRTVPPPWLYGSIAACALLYAVLFGLGAAVYRTLYLQPQNGR